MSKNLPARPHLDHLRRQAKALLAALDDRDIEAISTIQNHLPAACGMTAKQVLNAGFRLADAQYAIARKNGFGSWPQLARHVEVLRELEGTWSIRDLEIDGVVVPTSALQASRVLIDGDRFRTESPEATYEGVFNINVEADPHEIDIQFVAGPEAGNCNFGIFRLEGDEFKLCLDLNGKPRPDTFSTSPGSGHAYETLTRVSPSRPEGVTGVAGTAPPPSAPTDGCDRFEFIDSPTMAKLQGEWTAVKIIRDGQDLPSMMLRTGHRSASKNEVRISFGGQTMIHALVRLGEIADPIEIDYYNLDGSCPGAIQHGVMKWLGEEVCFCMAAQGKPRPEDFSSLPGTARVFSQWRRKK